MYFNAEGQTNYKKLNIFYITFYIDTEPKDITKIKTMR